MKVEVTTSYGSIDTTDEFLEKLQNEDDYNGGAGNIDNWSDYLTNKVGLHSDEEAYWVNQVNPPGGYSWRRLSPWIWAGIDCRGFVQRCAKAPRYSNGDKLVPDRVIPDLGDNPDYDIGCPGYAWLVNNLNEPGEVENYGNCYKITNDSVKLRYLHKGDIITTGSHIVIIYEEPVDNESTTFNVINAYGGEWYHSSEFVRRTIIMPYNWWKGGAGRISDSYQYGRVTIWQK